MSEKPQVNTTTDLVDQIMRFMRTVHSMKSAISRRDYDTPDRAAYGLLFPLMHRGSLRVGELADAIHSDPSTVSRHVSHLINKGLVQRVPDQQDGRASLLELTREGVAMCDAMRERRGQVLAALLNEWPQEDLADLARLLGRLNADMEDGLENIVIGMRNAFESVTDPVVTTDSKEPPKETP